MISFTVYLGITSLLDNFKWVNHTHKVLAKASPIEATAADKETAMNGSLIANQTADSLPGIYDKINKISIYATTF